MNRMRLRIAQRLKEAQNTCAMLTTFNEVDMRSDFFFLKREEALSHRLHIEKAVL